MRRILLMLGGLILLTTAIYWQVHRFDFIEYDDGDYVYNNRYVHAGFTANSIHYALVTYTMGNWNPLLWFSFFLDNALFHARPGPMHVENVLLHLITGILLWRLLFVATGNVNRSWLVAALFLCHPMHVESVAWICERKDVLSTPILLGAMLLYLSYCRSTTPKKRWLFYVLMLAVFELSLLVKTMGVTLPAVLLLMDFWPLKRWPGRSWFWLVVEKIPVLAISIIATIVGSIAQYHTGATSTFAELSLWDRITNAIVCYVIYVSKLVIPINLAVFYPHPQSRPAGAVFAAAVLLLMATYFAYRSRRQCPYLLCGWLWFVGTLVPVIGIMQLGSQAMADRYSYFPSIGLFIIFVWGLGDLFTRLQWVRLKTALAVCVTVLFTVVCYRQVSYWKNSEAIFTHEAEAADESPLSHVELANIAGAKGDSKRTVDELNRALSLGPYSRAYFGLGNCWIADKPELACGYYRKAAEMQPNVLLFHVQYAAGLLRWGAHWDEAMQQAQQAIDLDPSDPSAIDILAKVKAQKPK